MLNLVNPDLSCSGRLFRHKNAGSVSPGPSSLSNGPSSNGPQTHRALIIHYRRGLEDNGDLSERDLDDEEFSDEYDILEERHFFDDLD